MKICNTCEQEKPRSEFHSQASYKDGLNAKCKSCVKIRVREYIKNNYEHWRAVCKKAQKKYEMSADAARKKNNSMKSRRYRLKRKFGLTEIQLEQLKIQQGNRCAICKKTPLEAGLFKRELAVDHDHKTGKIRALLCSKCNNGLGLFNDDIELLDEAKKYLLTHFREAKRDN